MRIGTAIALLVLAGVVCSQDSFEGKITGGKALKLVQKALPMLKAGQAKLTQASRMGVDEGPEYEALLKECIAQFDEGTLLLNEALDLQYDGGINAMLVNAAKKMAWARARLLRIENKRRFQDRAPEPKPEPEPKPKPKPKPKPDPEPVPQPEPTPRPEPEREPTPRTSPKYSAERPPAEPGLYELPRIDLPDTREHQKQAKRDARSIESLLKAHYTARKPGKLLGRCRLCAGKGSFKDGGSCHDCGGSGRLINLHHFRKVFWTSFSPFLRDQPGALQALRGFYEYARTKPEVLGPEVKSFKLREVDYQGYWAEVVVELSTSKGKQRHAHTLVGIGSSWFFYCPQSDRELLEPGD